MIKSHQRPRPRKYRKHYRVTNWSDYERGLKSRGDITLWISDEAIDQWDQNEYKGRGRPHKYSSLAIETVLFIRLLFKLPLRQTEGFISSLFQLMSLDLDVPDHSTLSRRSQTLNPKIRCYGKIKGPIHIMIDSTGLSIHGEGKWTRHKHGKRKRRGWRKLHIATDQNGMIHAASLSDETKRDGAVAPNLIREVGEINSLITDSGYDEIKVYQTALNHMKPNGKIIIHPRSNAVVSANKKAALRQRNQHVKEIQSRGVFEWRKTSGYYQQSKVENSFYRYKTIIGDHLKSRREDSRLVESILACNLFNKFRLMTKPQSELIPK